MMMLEKLQNAQSHYAADDLKGEYKRNSRISRMIQKNSDRYIKNPVFLSNTLNPDKILDYSNLQTIGNHITC